MAQAVFFTAQCAPKSWQWVVKHNKVIAPKVQLVSWDAQNINNVGELVLVMFSDYASRTLAIIRMNSEPTLLLQQHRVTHYISLFFVNQFPTEIPNDNHRLLIIIMIRKPLLIANG